VIRSPGATNRQEEPFDRAQQVLGQERLLQKGCIRGRGAAMKQVIGWIGGNVEHRKRGVALAQPLAQGSSIQLRHQHVADDEVEVRICQGDHAQRLAAMVRLQGTVTGLIENPGQGPANHVFVLDHQDDPWLVSGYQWLAQKSLREGGDRSNLKLHAWPLTQEKAGKTRLRGDFAAPHVIPGSAALGCCHI
jgi:hypothetical protein